jgi:hypothetical protein
MIMTHALHDLEQRLAAGDRFSAADAERVMSCTDLVAIGALAGPRQAARQTVTFGRVLSLLPGQVDPPAQPYKAGEIRLAAGASSIEDLERQLEAVSRWTADAPILLDTFESLLALSGPDPQELAAVSARLKRKGVAGVARLCLDLSVDDSRLGAQVEAMRAAGLKLCCLAVHQTDGPGRLPIIERAVSLQEGIGGFEAFAPLPRVDDPGLPSTGYDDVRTVAVARLRCTSISRIQLDWQLYGPKLAQVAILFGASDLDAVSAFEDVSNGPRRTPLADIRRQIEAAGAAAAERDGVYRHWS